MRKNLPKLLFTTLLEPTNSKNCVRLVYQNDYLTLFLQIELDITNNYPILSSILYKIITVRLPGQVLKSPLQLQKSKNIQMLLEQVLKVQNRNS